MKTSYLLTIISILFALTGQAQSKHALFLSSGYTYNTNIKINGKEVKNSRGYILSFGLSYRALQLKTFSIEIGLAGKTIFSSGELGTEQFSANTLRLAMPITFVVPITKKWHATSGFFFQNNVDISEFDFRLRDKYSWRVDFTIGARYTINEHWYLSGGFALNLRDIPEAYFINDPKVSFLVGIARHSTIFKNKKNKQ